MKIYLVVWKQKFKKWIQLVLWRSGLNLHSNLCTCFKSKLLENWRTNFQSELIAVKLRWPVPSGVRTCQLQSIIWLAHYWVAFPITHIPPSHSIMTDIFQQLNWPSLLLICTSKSLNEDHFMNILPRITLFLGFNRALLNLYVLTYDVQTTKTNTKRKCNFATFLSSYLLS